jgi:hypothetical protein
MEPKALTATIRHKLTLGTLPRDLPSATVQPRGAVQAPHIRLGLVKGHPCSACDEPNPEITYNYPDGRAVWFHEECEGIWLAERRKPSSE